MKLHRSFSGFIFFAVCAVIPAKDKSKQDPRELSPLDQFILSAEQNNSSLDASKSPGSIWSDNARFANLATDLRARRVDDLVTIVVDEKASAVATGDVKTSRASTAQASITAAGGITRATGPLANLAKTNTQTALQGQGTTSRGATLNATLTARVTHVLPNGFLVVEGTKHVQVNSENQVITVRGVIRPFDLDPVNAVSSDRIAQMEIQVNGKGVVGDSIRRPFFLYRLLLGLLPF
jgi:flagellar L-ring protein precursor FlgH